MALPYEEFLYVVLIFQQINGIFSRLVCPKNATLIIQPALTSVKL